MAPATKAGPGEQVTLGRARAKAYARRKRRYLLLTLALWTGIALLVQWGVLFYLEHLVTGSGKIQEQDIVIPRKKIGFREEYSLPVRGELGLFSLSYDASYFAFTDEDGLKVYSLKDEKIVYEWRKDKEPLTYRGDDKKYYEKNPQEYPADTRVTYLKWLPDRNMLIYALEWRRSSSGPVNIDIITSDPKGMAKRMVHSFKGWAEGTRVKDLALSTMTNLVYVLLETPSKKDFLYKVDIMNAVTLLTSGSLGEIEVASRDGSLYAEVFTGPGRVSINYIASGSGNVRLLTSTATGKSYRLLGTDAEGNLYVGTGDGGIDTVYRAIVERETKSYTRKVYVPRDEVYRQESVTYTTATLRGIEEIFTLPAPVLREKLFVASDGTIALFDWPKKGKVTFFSSLGVREKELQLEDGEWQFMPVNKYICVVGQQGEKYRLVVYNPKQKEEK